MPSVPDTRGSGDRRSTHSLAPASSTATCCRQKPFSGAAGSPTHEASSANPLPSRAKPGLCAQPGSPSADGIRGGAPKSPGSGSPTGPSPADPLPAEPEEP